MTFAVMSTSDPTQLIGDLRGRLIFLGHLQGAAAGSFDHHTEDAVRQYQHAVGHEQTGWVDESLWLQLCADTDASGYDAGQAAAGAYDAATNQAVVEEDGGEYWPKDLRNVLNDLANAITALAGHHALGIGSACGYFQAYADNRLDSLGHYSGSDYLKNLSRHVAGEGGKEISAVLTAGLAATGVGAPAAFLITSIWIAFSMTAERRIGNAAKDALADKDDLRSAIPGLVLAISNEMASEYAGLERDMKAAIDDIIVKINTHELLDAQTDEWLRRLLDAGPTQRDAFIEREVGIPITADAVRDRMYHILVEAFEEMVLTTTDFRPSPFDAAAATMLAAANPDHYASPDAVVHERDAERHRRAVQAADEAGHNLPQAPPPFHR